MALEPGIYCVFNAPGGPAPGEQGLPGVRITASPGGHPGHVSVASFGADGWIGVDSAALVRVTGAVGDLLVTVYQAQNSQGEAPKLQVVRLTGEQPQGQTQAQASGKGQAAVQGAAANVPAQVAAAPAVVEVVAHVYGRGDLGGRLGDWIGDAGSQRWIEGFGVAPAEGIASTDIEYQAVLGRGWLSPWSEGGQFCGSRGMSLPILGMRIRLKGAAAKTHRVALSASFVDGTKIGPVGDGEACEAPSLAALEAFQLAIVPIPVKTAAPARPARGASTRQPEPVQAAPSRRRVSAQPERTTPPKVAPKAVTAKPPAKAASTKPASTRANVAKPTTVPAQAAAQTPGKTPAKSSPKPSPKAAKTAATPATPVSKPSAKPGAKPGPRTSAKRTPATTRRR